MKSKVIIAVLAISLVLTLLYAFIQKTQAATNFALAEMYRLEAEDQKKRAEESMHLAEWQKHEAEKAHAARLDAENKLGRSKR